MNKQKIEVNGEFDDIIELQNSIFHIIESDFENDEEEDITEIYQKYFTDKVYFIQLIKTIVMIITSRPLLLDRTIKFISLISEQIKTTFTKSEIILYFSFNLSVIYHLISLNIITFDDIMRDKIYTSMNFIIFFAPEIEKNDPIYYSNTLNNSYYLKLFRSNNDDDSIQSKRKTGMNHLKIARIIQNDDAESLQEMVAQDNLKIDYQIPKSDFETNEFLNKLKTRITMIEYAAFCGSVTTFKFLLLQGATLHPLITELASAGGNADIIHLLEQQKINFNKSCLEICIIFHQNQIFEYLHSNYNIPFSFAQLMLSISFYNFFCFNLILSENPPFLLLEEQTQCDLLVHCCKKGNQEIFQFLIKFINLKEYNLLQHKENLFSWCCFSGNSEMVKYLIGLDDVGKNDVNYTNENSLHHSCLYGNLDVVKLLVNSHLYPINQPSKMNSTPLHFAASRGHFNVVEFLVKECKNEVNINSVTKAWVTPLMEAVEKGFYKIVVLLCNCENIDLNCKDFTGKTALHIAALNGHSQIVSFLIDLPGIELNSIDKNGSTPLHLAVQSNKIQCIKILVEKKGVNINLKDNAIFFFCF